MMDKQKIIENIVSEFKEHLESAVEKLEDPIRKMNILTVDQNIVPVKEFEHCLDQCKA